jgi:putative hemolysin
LGRFPSVQPYARAISTTIVVLAITYVSLVIGELVPKRLALNHPETVARLVALPMQVLSRITAPFVHFLTLSTDFVLLLLGSKSGRNEDVTEEDIRGLIEKGTEAGVIHETEQVLMERVFTVGDLRVSALMIPRIEIDWLGADYPIERIRIAVATSSHSHFPVCRGGLDELIGVVHVKEMVKHGLMAGSSIDLTKLAQKPMFVPETTLALDLLNQFKESSRHLAFVVDEFGGIEGLITLNDIVEAIIGQITRAGEESAPLIVQRGQDSWLIDGMLPIAELKRLLALEALPKEDEAGYQTVGGMVITQLGQIPRTGQRFDWEAFSFEVVDMDRHRVDKVMVTRKPIAEPAI